jgi:hypothetical protein
MELTQELTGTFWDSFDELERRRKTQRVRHEQAFRQLDVATSAPEDGNSLRAWESYCEAARSLESCVAELERIVWQFNR